jgi:hypothetical protein
MFRPNLPSSGVQVDVVRDSAARYNMVIFLPLLVASGYFGCGLWLPCGSDMFINRQNSNAPGGNRRAGRRETQSREPVNKLKKKRRKTPFEKQLAN